MKPTQEQVIAWARSVGMEISEDTFVNFDIWELKGACTLAYEAGRKDENEACAKVCEHNAAFGNVDERYASRNCAELIRARREQ